MGATSTIVDGDAGRREEASRQGPYEIGSINSDAHGICDVQHAAMCVAAMWVHEGCEFVCPLQGPKSPKNREKRVSESKNPHFPTTPEKGVPSQKIPIFLVVLCIEMGIF